MKPFERDHQFQRDLAATEAYRQLVNALAGTDYTEAQLLALLRGVRDYQGQAEQTVPQETWEEFELRLGDRTRTSSLVTTDILALDKLLDGGFLPGSVVGVVGGPAVGKSTLIRQILYNIAKRGTECAYVMLEGGIGGYRWPMLALETGISVKRIKYWDHAVDHPTDEEYARLRAGIASVSALPIVHDMGANSIDKIERLLDKNHGAKVLAVDSMHLVSGVGETTIGQIEYVSKNLLRIAAHRGLVVLALCEVNRTGMDIKDPVWIPEPFNIRGSHQLNHDFGDALLLARVRRSEALLVRDGKGRYRDEVGDIFLRFDGAGQTVTDGMHMEQVWEADAARLRAEYGFKGKGGRIDRSTPDTSTEGF